MCNAAARGNAQQRFRWTDKGGPSSEPWSRLHFQLEFGFPLFDLLRLLTFLSGQCGIGLRLRESCRNDRHRRTRTAIRSRGIPMTEFSSVKTRDAGAAFCDPGGSCCFPLLKQRGDQMSHRDRAKLFGTA